jgi:phage shock protein C
MKSRRQGFGMNLYRNTKAKKIGGVCAGIADHFEIDHNIARIAFVAAFLFTGVLAFWAYIIAWIVLVPKEDAQSDDSYEYDEGERRYRKKKMFRYKESTSVRLQRARERLDSLAERVQGMEHYVTSRRYDLNKQFADLEK